MSLSHDFDGWRDVMDSEVANWSGAVALWQKHTALSLEGARVLEIGAHRGGLSLYAAVLGAEVVCSDIESPERPAGPVHLTYAVDDRITYRAVNATAIDFTDASFDLVLFKSVLGGLGEWSHGQSRAMAEIARVLKPEGEVWFTTRAGRRFDDRDRRCRAYEPCAGPHMPDIFGDGAPRASAAPDMADNVGRQVTAA